jgi:hypothetical protein
MGSTPYFSVQEVVPGIHATITTEDQRVSGGGPEGRGEGRGVESRRRGGREGRRREGRGEGKERVGRGGRGREGGEEGKEEGERRTLEKVGWRAGDLRTPALSVLGVNV